MGLIQTETKRAEALASGPSALWLRYPRSCALLMVLILVGSATCGWGQQSDDASPGVIFGVIEGRDGAVYEGAHVALDETASPELLRATATSDGNGRFSFASVPPGPFKLTVSAAGFRSQEVSGVLGPGQSFDARAIVLDLTTASSEVHVSASQVEVAEEQLRAEETQRVLGVIPNFYVSYVPNAPPLTPRQKFDLAWKSSIDPIAFAATAAFAGVEQADNAFSGYGQGVAGYAKRFGANYADNFISTMIGGALLPVALKQDPRYFYKGTGTVRSRVFYALASAVICKGDNGRWQPNYSGIVGGLAAGGISNLYYPAADRNGAELTFQNAAIGTAAGAVQNLLQEFVVRRLTPKIPNYGASQP